MAFGLNSPAWSVGVELFLYAAFPLVLWLMVRLPARQVALVLAAAVLGLATMTGAAYALAINALPSDDPMSAHRLLYRTPLTRLPDFVIGVSIALLVVRGPGANRWAASVQWVSVAAVGAMMCWYPMLYSVWSWDAAYAVVFAALIWSLALAPGAPIARLLAQPLVVKGGLISYAFYLFHWPLIHLAEVDASSGRAWLFSTAVTLAAVLLVAAGAHLAIEVPAQRWLRRRLSVNSATAPAALAAGDDPGHVERG